MRNRLILLGLGLLMILAAMLILWLAHIEPPAPTPSAQVDDHDHAAELLPPAPVGRTLFGGNSGRLRASPVVATLGTRVPRTATPTSGTGLEVFAPARFQI